MVIAYWLMGPMFDGDRTHGHVNWYRDERNNGVRLIDVCDGASDCIWFVPGSEAEQINTLQLVVEF